MYSTGVTASTLHPLDWETGVLRKSLWGESLKTINSFISLNKMHIIWKINVFTT